MGIALGLGLSTAGAIVGAAGMWFVVFRLMGVGTSGENYETPTTTLPMGLFGLAGTGLFIACMIIMASVITGRI